MVGNYSAKIESLDDLTALWFALLEDLNAAHVDTRLTLVYRSQEYLRNIQQEEKGKAREEPAAAETISAQEQADIDRAIQASLYDFATSNQVTVDVYDAHATTSHLGEGSSSSATGQDLSPSTSPGEVDSGMLRTLGQSLEPNGTSIGSESSRGECLGLSMALLH